MQELPTVKLIDALQRAEWLIDSPEEFTKVEAVFDQALQYLNLYERTKDQEFLESYIKNRDQVFKSLKIDSDKTERQKLLFIRYRLKQNKQYLSGLKL